MALALTLAATKLVADFFMPRRNTEAKAAKKPAHGKSGHGGGTARLGLFRRTRQHASLASQPPASQQQQDPVKPPENTG